MKDKINTYFAILLITIAGAGATLIIIHIATKNSFLAVSNSEAAYASLQESILTNSKYKQPTSPKN